eukprot:9495223-Lingulodinium_polyedra.AAC.1
MDLFTTPSIFGFISTSQMWHTGHRSSLSLATAMPNFACLHRKRLLSVEKLIFWRNSGLAIHTCVRSQVRCPITSLALGDQYFVSCVKGRTMALRASSESFDFFWPPPGME